MRMNFELKDALVDSAVAEVPPRDDEEWDEEMSYKLYKAARLCHLYGRLEQAAPYYRRALEGQERVLGPEHPSTLTSGEAVQRGRGGEWDGGSARASDAMV